MANEKTLGRVLAGELKDKIINDEFANEDFWACHGALVKKYCELKKRVFLRDGKTISAIEDYEKEIEYNLVNLITSLEKYNGIFNGDNYSQFLDGYKALLPKALPSIEGENFEDLVALADKVLGYAIREKLTSKDSGININPNFGKKKMLDFDRDRQAMTEEFLALIEIKFGKEGKENAISHVREEGIEAIESMIKYYTEVASYWCDFLSKIEITRQEEEDNEWA